PRATGVAFDDLAVLGDDAVEVAVGHGNQVVAADATLRRDVASIGRVREQSLYIEHHAAGITGDADVIFAPDMPFRLGDHPVLHLEPQRHHGRFAVFFHEPRIAGRTGHRIVVTALQ